MAFALAAPALALRPQLFAIAIFAALLLLVARRDRNPRAIWLAPLLVLAWANIHGSFVLAPILLGYAWLDDLVRGRPARRSFAVLVLGTAATLVNPFAAGVWAYAAGIGANPAIAGQVTEWQRTTPFTVPGLLFYLSGAAAFALAFRGRAGLRWPDWLWLATLFAIGVWAVRGLAWWPFGAVFAIGGLPDALWPASRATGVHRVSRLPAVVAVLLGVLVVAALPWWRPADPITGRTGILSYAPSGIAAALRDLAPAGTRVLAAQTWTSFLEWAVPDAQYFLDSRFELFPAEVWADRATIAAGGPAADEVLERWGVDLLVLPAGTDLDLAGWVVVYEDADGVILARTPYGRPPPVPSGPRWGPRCSARVGRMVHADTTRVLDVVVLGGGGHVRSSLSLALADAGLRVGIFDINQATLQQIGRGEMPFLENGADELLPRVLATGRLELGSSAEMIGRAETVILVIGTPVDEFLGPSMHVFERAVDQIAPHVRDGALVILRSTVYPGTTAYVAAALEDRGSHVDVAFCPERFAEGHALEEFHSLPQVVGADTPAAGDRAEALFGRLPPTTIRTSTKDAELTKLFTNTWRYMKFAVANQFFAIADQAGVDYTNVLRAIREDYPRAADLPGRALPRAPACLKDTMQLAAFTSDHFPMGQAAMQINEGMPAYIVTALERAARQPPRGGPWGSSGMAFQAESDDIPASLSFKLAQAPRVGRAPASWAPTRT